MFFSDKAKWNPKLPKVFTVTCKMNAPAKFALHVIANPPPTKVTWFHPNNQASIDKGFTAAKVNDTTYTLRKTSIVIDDYGNYTVNVTNTVGTSTFTFEIQRAGKLTNGICILIQRSKVDGHSYKPRCGSYLGQETEVWHLIWYLSLHNMNNK
jgi:hypothetical protein